jgi:hypothetical protein
VRDLRGATRAASPPGRQTDEPGSRASRGDHSLPRPQSTTRANPGAARRGRTIDRPTRPPRQRYPLVVGRRPTPRRSRRWG